MTINEKSAMKKALNDVMRPDLVKWGLVKVVASIT